MAHGHIRIQRRGGSVCVTDVSTSVGAGYPKHAYIPDGGFVLCANTGNDYSQSGGIDYTNGLSTAAYNAIASLSPGDTAYVVGADIADGTIETQGSPYYGDSFVSEAKNIYRQQAGKRGGVSTHAQ